MKLYTDDAIKEQVHKLLCQDCEETDVCPICDYRELIDEILDATTVDAVTVVRCKDCKWCKPINSEVRGFYKNCMRHEIAVYDDGFCAWGEREEDD